MKEGRHLSLVLLGDVIPRGVSPVTLTAVDVDQARHRFWNPVGKADLVVLNLEAPLTGTAAPRSAKRFNYRSHPELAGVFDSRCVVGLANNHVMDFGRQGLRDTMAALTARQCAWTGAGETLDRAREPAVVEVEGRTLGVICAADPRFSAATRSGPGTFPAEAERLAQSITSLKSRADLVVATLHMGLEYTSWPTPRMRHLARTCIGAGADVVQFHHAHRVSGVTRLDQGLVLWGTGNYWMWPRRSPASRRYFCGGVWRLRWDTAAGTVRFAGMDPVFAGRYGEPLAGTHKETEHARTLVARWSRRLHQDGLAVPYLLPALLHPEYLKQSLPNYLHILRCQGPGKMLQQILASLRVQMCCRPGRD